MNAHTSFKASISTCFSDYLRPPLSVLSALPRLGLGHHCAFVGLHSPAFAHEPPARVFSGRPLSSGWKMSGALRMGRASIVGVAIALLANTDNKHNATAVAFEISAGVIDGLLLLAATHRAG